MRDIHAFSQLASLIGEPARARMLEALMGGIALTATELALAADVASSTASSHLEKLRHAGVLIGERQGRHRYFRLADAEIAEVLESLSSVADRRSVVRPRTGSGDPALREARVCYDHLAGERGVWLLDRLRGRGLVQGRDTPHVSAMGIEFFVRFGIDVTALSGGRRPLCRLCLDWSERKHHLAGALGAALLDRFLELRWARRIRGSRALAFSEHGARAFRGQFGA